MALEVLGGEWKGRIERLERWVKGLRVYGASGFKNDLNSGAAITIPSPSASGSQTGTYTVLLKITGNATGNGWYTASLWIPASGISVSSSLTEAQLGTAGASCYYGNLNEQGASTHDLTNAANTTQKLFFARFWGTASDGTPLYVGNGIWTENCS